MNDKTLVVVCGYAGDQQQIEELRPWYEHHRCPIVIMSPDDSRIERVGPHICRFGGKRAYIGQDSLDRQWIHMRMALEYEFDWYLLHDSDSIIMTPEIPAYLYERDDVVWSNQVTDFRVPGATWVDVATGATTVWPEDYHAGFPLIAMQPPYFLSRKMLTHLVAMSAKWDSVEDSLQSDKARNAIQACPICPFIDWYWVQLVVKAQVEHRGFINGASCETVTKNGLEVMSNRVAGGSTIIHAIKSGKVARHLSNIHRRTLTK